MGLFDQLGNKNNGQQRQITQEEMRAEIGNIKADPGAYLQARGFNIPGGMTDAKEITRYLLQSGQIGGNRLQQVMRLLGR